MRYKLLILLKMEYFLPEIAQILSSYNDLKSPSPVQSNSKFQLNS